MPAPSRQYDCQRDDCRTLRSSIWRLEDAFRHHLPFLIDKTRWKGSISFVCVCVRGGGTGTGRSGGDKTMLMSIMVFMSHWKSQPSGGVTCKPLGPVLPYRSLGTCTQLPSRHRCPLLGGEERRE